ncbi:MAG: SDR family NAD(P)-dependent oxidoreductase [Dongiaceae bacterium]
MEFGLQVHELAPDQNQRGMTVITGASTGIGRGLAIELARRGEFVALLARRQNLLEEVAASICAAGGRAIVRPCDVTDRAQVLAAFEELERKRGPIERVIANAGGGYKVPSERLSGADVEAMLAVNLVGAVHCVEAALPGMLARGRGHLVFMGSLAGEVGLPQAAAYSAAKAAVARLGEGLRVDLQPRGIDVTVLMPGFVRTRDRRKRRPFEMPLARATARMTDTILDRRPICRFPWTLVALLAVAAILPTRLRDALLRRTGKRAVRSRG